MLRRVSDRAYDAPPVAAVTDRPMGRLGVLIARVRREIRYLGKFGVVGAISWVIDTIVFNAFLTWLDNGYTAAVLSTMVSASAAFIGNRFWTWRDRSRSTLHREYMLYAFFNAIGLLIALACLWISHDLLGAWQPAVFHSRLADNVAKQGFGLVLGTIFRFWAYRRYVFRGATVQQAVTVAPLSD
jgi:putative flippase GtrA